MDDRVLVKDLWFSPKSRKGDNKMKNSTQGGSPILTKDKLHGYQNKAVQHILDKPRCALWLGMGLRRLAKQYQH